jgi:hypothetical protein
MSIQNKAHVVVFRQPGCASPTTPLLYPGQPQQFVKSCMYLRVTLHATKCFATASDELALEGCKAMFALSPLHWEAVFNQGKDPRQGPSESLRLRTHAGWGTAFRQAPCIQGPAALPS